MATPETLAGPAADIEATVDATSRRRPGFGSWLARVVLALLFALGLFFSAFPQGRTAARVALLFPSIISVSPPAPLKLLGSPVRHTRLTLPAPPEPVYLDVYAPATPVPAVPGSREGIVVISGVGDNRSDPQLINLSESFARAGIVVMDVTTPTLLAYDMSPADGTAVVEAFERLARWPGVSPRRVGIVGFSAGGAIASLAAANPQIRDRLSFLTLFGSYFDATAMLGDFGRRALLINGRLQPWQPDEVSIQVLANIIAGVLPSAEGSAVVKSVAPGGKLLSAKELAGFSPAALAAYHLLAGDERSPAEVNANIARLSPRMRSVFDSLSPSSVVRSIHAPVHLLHDRDDHYVPVTESEDYAAALARLGHHHDFVEFGIFQHVEVESNLRFGQIAGAAPGLFRMLYETLRTGA